MQYYTTNERRSKIAGAVAVLLYLGVWILVICLVTFRFDAPTQGEGILINFGDTEQAAGEADPSLNENALAAQQNSNDSGDKEYITTQDHEDAPVVEQKKPTTKKVDKTVVKPTPTKQTQTVQPTEQPQQVNKRALFRGKTEGSTSTSEGTGQGTGNQGNPAGDPAGSHSGTGMGTSGSSFNLEGRNLVGSLPKPEYPSNEEGKVVVQIVVDQNGAVTSASFRSSGSTTQNNALVNAALRAARKAKFTVNDSDTQTGTITYTFKMK